MQPASMSAATTTPACKASILPTILTPDPAEEQTLALARTIPTLTVGIWRDG